MLAEPAVYTASSSSAAPPCETSAANPSHHVTFNAERKDTEDTEASAMLGGRRMSHLGGLHGTERRKSSIMCRSVPSLRSLLKVSVESDIEAALKTHWAEFDWTRDCVAVHEGSTKVVGRLLSHPGIAIASVSRGTGEGVLQTEIDILSALRNEGIRTIAFSSQIFEVPHFEGTGSAKAYLLQYFSQDVCFLYEEGEPGTEDHFLEPMRKLRILQGDEGDWTMNRDAIRVVKENGLEQQFMEDLTAYVKLLQTKGVRIVDFQCVLGTDGHIYVADPLRIEPINEKVNRYFLDGVFSTSAHPKRENKPRKATFVDGLGMDLGVPVLDEE